MTPCPGFLSLSLSLSGGGHLLPYHLAVCHTLFLQTHVEHGTAQRLPPIRHVAGSSAGSIAATVMTQAPERLKEFADRFIQDRGRGLHHLREVLKTVRPRAPPTTAKTSNPHHSMQLHICTTKCHDGSVHLFHYDPAQHADFSVLMNWVKASCTIPPSFHPIDVLNSSGSLPYSDAEGILTEDGNYHVDGGIAGPAPPTPDDKDCHHCVTVSPISGSIMNLNSSLSRISPRDTSFAFFLPELHCRGGFRVRTSIQNLRALRVASGAATSSELREWWVRGEQDAARWVAEWVHAGGIEV